MDTIDPADYTTIGGEPFITWPLASPTSMLGINVRFYAIDEGDEFDARYRIDIGADVEALMERLYRDFDLASRGISVKTFEETVRGLYQQRLAAINAYGIVTTLYVVCTTDPWEMQRLHRREQHVLASQRRRWDHTAYPVYRAPRPGVRRFRAWLRWCRDGLYARLVARWHR